MAKTIGSLAAIGSSGPVSEHFVQGFLDRGVKLRILARDAAAVSARYPGAEVIGGSMLNPSDVARTMEGVDAAFVMTPMGFRNDPQPEIDAARSVIAGARSSGLKHFIYTSVMDQGPSTGVGIFDAKVVIERMLEDSGLGRTVMRCGTYMEDVFDSRLSLLNKGKFMFPVTKSRRFTYTSQRDVPRFVAEKLLGGGAVSNAAFNFVSPGTYAISDVEQLLSEASGIPIKALAKYPNYYLFVAAYPYFKSKGDRMSSIIPLIRYFDKHGYLGAGPTVADLWPDFHMTSLQEHFQALWPASTKHG